jgi:molybdopterin-containing oxidoreductase family membrane subunit
MEKARSFWRFIQKSVRLVVTGNRYYYAWVVFLLLVMGFGVAAYVRQIKYGLILTHMRDQVSWGFYIGNFTFLVGIAAAAVMLVIPAYIYNWKPIKEITLLGEILALAALVMCLGFVLVDIGRPDRFWHIIPFVGLLNFPSSMLSWDVLVLNGYLFINWAVVTYMLFCAYQGKPYRKGLVYPLVILSIPWAVSIHTITAFLYNALPARPFWNASILAPRFLASAFCSGPAILLILLQVLRKMTRLEITDQAIFKIAELMAYAMGINLFLQGAEIFKEFYSHTEHFVFTQYLYFGFHGHNTLVPYAWASVLCGVAAFLLFLLPRTRRNWVTLNIGCVLIYSSVYIEKGMGLIIPGFTPSTLGEIYEYVPSWTEIKIAMGIFALGFLVFTFMLKVAVPIMLGEFTKAGNQPTGT